MPGQSKADIDNYRSVTQLVLEDTVAVTKTTVFTAQYARLAGLEIKEGKRMNKFCEFAAVGTNILYGCRTYTTGYQREIF